MGLVGVSGFGYLVGGTPALKLVGQTSMRTVTDYTFGVIPMFLLMGAFVTTSGMSRELFGAANLGTALGVGQVAFALTVYAGVTMVSNAPFYSGKALDVRFRVPFAGVLLVVVAFVLVSSDPPLMLFGLFVLYGFSGYAWWGYMAMRGRPNPARSSEKPH